MKHNVLFCTILCLHPILYMYQLDHLIVPNQISIAFGSDFKVVAACKIPTSQAKGFFRTYETKLSKYHWLRLCK